MKRRTGLRIAVFASGFGSNLGALLAAERRGRLGGRVELVVSDRPDAAAIVRANRANRPVFLAQPAEFASREAYDRAVLGVLRKAEIGLVALAGFMRILTPEFVRALEGRILNVHPSLLPAFKGAHAVRDAFAHGVRWTGVTVHFVTAELDDGPIVLQEAVRIGPRDTEKSLERKIHRVEHRLYPEAVRLFAAGRLRLRGRKVIIA